MKAEKNISTNTNKFKATKEIFVSYIHWPKIITMDIIGVDSPLDDRA